MIHFMSILCTEFNKLKNLKQHFSMVGRLELGCYQPASFHQSWLCRSSRGWGGRCSHVKGGRVNRAWTPRHTQFNKCDRPAEQWACVEQSEGVSLPSLRKNGSAWFLLSQKSRSHSPDHLLPVHGADLQPSLHHSSLGFPGAFSSQH